MSDNDAGGRVWQSIETAPKDGTWVILATTEGVEPGYWGPTYFSYNPDWVQYSHRSESVLVFGEPTHWMPLPDPPDSETSPQKKTPDHGEG